MDKTGRGRSGATEATEAREARDAGAPVIPYFLSADAAERHGVDLGEALQAGLVTCDDLREVFTHCRDCTDGSGLRHDETHAVEAAAAPDWCANKDVLDGLRDLVPRRR